MKLEASRPHVLNHLDPAAIVWLLNSYHIGIRLYIQGNSVHDEFTNPAPAMNSLLSLPLELLHQVASCLVTDNDVSDIVSFASTCHATRTSARSLLFRSMTVASVSKLESLSNADAAILGYMRYVLKLTRGTRAKFIS